MMGAEELRRKSHTSSCGSRIFYTVRRSGRAAGRWNMG